MSSQERNMNLTFIDRKERKIQSPLREVVSPTGQLYFPLGSSDQSSTGQRSPESVDHSLSQRISNSQEDASNNNGLSLSDSAYFGSAFPARLTSEQEAELLRELEQDTVRESSGQLQFDMRYMDRKEANMHNFSQHGRKNSQETLAGSQLDKTLVGDSEGVRTFSNSISMQINSPMNSPYISVLSNPLSFKDEGEEEKCDTRDRAYEIRSTTSVMLFQERNLFADEKEAAEAAETSSEDLGEDSVQLDCSDSWRSESMAAKLWRLTDSHSSSTGEDLPDVEVFPAVASMDDINESRESEQQESMLIQESFSPSFSEITHSQIAISNSMSCMDTNQLEKHKSATTEPLIPPAKKIEVERKFVITNKCVDKLNELGALLNVEKTFTDCYYDDPKYSLTLKNCWLRKRNKNWELKVTKDMSCELSIHNEELTEERDIVKYLIQHYDMQELSEEISASELVKRIGLEEFATFTTCRQSYSLPECIIDLDITDFGFQVGEIEVMVTHESRIPSALNIIDDMAKKLGFQCLTQVL